MNLPIIKKEEALQAERLELKIISGQDCERLAYILSNRKIAQTYMIPDYKTPELFSALAQRLIEYSAQEDSRHLVYGIYLDGVLIGFINDCGITDDEIELGYVIHPDYQGQGYATQAVRAIIKELGEMGFKKIKAGYFAGNDASRRVMEKCGMTQTGSVVDIEYRNTVRKCILCELCL